MHRNTHLAAHAASREWLLDKNLVKFLLSSELVDYALHTSSARGRSLGRVKLEVNGIKVPAIERMKKGFGLGISLQCGQEVIRNDHVSGTCIGRVPSVVLFRSVYCCEAGWHHETLRYQSFRVLNVGCGPQRFGSPRANPLKIRLGIHRLFSAIDPPPGETFDHALPPSHRWKTGRRFEDSDIQLFGGVMVLREPCSKIACCAKG